MPCTTSPSQRSKSGCPPGLPYPLKSRTIPSSRGLHGSSSPPPPVEELPPGPPPTPAKPPPAAGSEEPPPEEEEDGSFRLAMFSGLAAHPARGSTRVADSNTASISEERWQGGAGGRVVRI